MQSWTSWLNFIFHWEGPLGKKFSLLGRSARFVSHKRTTWEVSGSQVLLISRPRPWGSLSRTILEPSGFCSMSGHWSCGLLHIPSNLKQKNSYETFPPCTLLSLPTLHFSLFLHDIWCSFLSLQHLHSPLWWISPELTLLSFYTCFLQLCEVNDYNYLLPSLLNSKVEKEAVSTVLYPRPTLLACLYKPKAPKKDSALGWATHPPTGSLSAVPNQPWWGFWTISRCHRGLHSWGQGPKYLAAADKQSKMHCSQHSSVTPGHCFNGVHSSIMQKLLKLLHEDHSEEPQKNKNSQFSPLLHWMMQRKRTPLSPMTASNFCTEQNAVVSCQLLPQL